MTAERAATAPAQPPEPTGPWSESSAAALEAMRRDLRSREAEAGALRAEMAAAREQLSRAEARAETLAAAAAAYRCM